jgi:hypothetical protein
MSKLQEKPSALKGKHPALQNIKFFNFSIFVAHLMLIWIHNTGENRYLLKVEMQYQI